jgi:hypothetical protein
MSASGGNSVASVAFSFAGSLFYTTLTDHNKLYITSSSILNSTFSIASGKLSASESGLLSLSASFFQYNYSVKNTKFYFFILSQICAHLHCRGNTLSVVIWQLNFPFTLKHVQERFNYSFLLFLLLWI